MSFNGAELPRRNLPEGASFAPLVSTEVGEIELLHNGEKGLKPPMSAHGIGNRALTAVLLRWKQRKLIEDYDPPGKLDRKGDYHIRISGTQDEQSSILGALVTGATLYLFPSSATVIWTWNFELTDSESGEIFSVATKSSVTQWLHLIFLPALPFSITGQLRADRDLSYYVYDELRKQGAWRDSEN